MREFWAEKILFWGEIKCYFDPWPCCKHILTPEMMFLILNIHAKKNLVFIMSWNLHYMCWKRNKVTKSVKTWWEYYPKVMKNVKIIRITLNNKRQHYISERKHVFRCFTFVNEKICLYNNMNTKNVFAFIMVEDEYHNFLPKTR